MAPPASLSYFLANAIAGNLEPAVEPEGTRAQQVHEVSCRSSYRANLWRFPQPGVPLKAAAAV